MIIQPPKEENELFCEYMDLEQAMHGAQDLFPWDEPKIYAKEDLNIEGV